MKPSFYKFIAIVSVMLGALGPQVASGQQGVTVPALQDQSAVAYAVSVVSAPTVVRSIQNNTSPSQSQNQSCKTDIDAPRLDILLWQGCDDLVLAPEQSLPQVAVVSQPTNLPQLAVQSPINFSSPVSLTSTQTTENVMLPNNGLALKSNGFSKLSVLILADSVFVTQLVFDQPYRLQTIVMRC